MDDPAAAERKVILVGSSIRRSPVAFVDLIFAIGLLMVKPSRDPTVTAYSTIPSLIFCTGR